ncbi:radical SAM protein [Azoarcus sp. L1K30]|uniref:radical SAM protein n=1 Tax=Azoarcus sp. L1K30 TaxID=2820277 RepID=UPI000CB1D533|nr:radical SAM protein [Azoarcus sp. L1K30]MBR0567617.1 radical SAM protein [Azoarcus sp. L1K30]PLX75734.1 MAG: radical SAM protein [Azoarcus sp.]
MSRKNRPWLFYDTTASVCTTCLRQVEAKIVIKGDDVFLDKWCPAHGSERVLIADDAAYYRLGREVYVKAPEMPERFNTPMRHGCPYDCGLCPDHMQHSCLSVVEITEHCNLRCPVCYAESGPERQTHRSLAEVEAMLDAVVANEGEPDVVQLSGGEPTLHPDFFAILDAARARPIRHLMINTNGLRIARDEAFVARLAGYRPGIEIYLQFDSLHDAVLQQMRGADLADIHARALARLEAHGLSTTLVMTVKRGVNDDQIGEVIQHGLQYRCVRGVTLQPVSDAGRNVDFDAARHRLTVSEVRRRVAEQSGLFTLDDIVPVPCNPDTLAMGYALKLGDEVLPLTRHLGPDALLAGPRNTIVFERDPAMKEAVFKLFSTNHSPESQASCLSSLLCCLPAIAAPALGYENVFRVLIVQFMDAANLDLRALKKSCVHFAQPDGRLIPFEAYNLFYRGERIEKTREIQAEIAAATARRR